MEEAELYMSLNAGGNSHTQSILYGGGPSLTNSSGVPWTAAYVDSRGDPTCDLRSNIAAESRAKIIYERLINITDDPGVKDALGRSEEHTTELQSLMRISYAVFCLKIQKKSNSFACYLFYTRRLRHRPLTFDSTLHKLNISKHS